MVVVTSQQLASITRVGVGLLVGPVVVRCGAPAQVEDDTGAIARRDDGGRPNDLFGRLGTEVGLTNW